MKIVVKLSRSDVSRSAMIHVGIDPRALAIKPGTRVEKDRKKEARKGARKHKGRAYD
jgi:hypothetical protein